MMIRLPISFPFVFKALSAADVERGLHNAVKKLSGDGEPELDMDEDACAYLAESGRRHSHPAAPAGRRHGAASAGGPSHPPGRDGPTPSVRPLSSPGWRMWPAASP